MQIVDTRNTLRVSQSGGLIASGNRRFVELVSELAAGQQSQSNTLAPVGFKVYYLRYAWAQDVSAQYGGTVTVIPGVASILRSLLTAQRGGAAPALTQYRGAAEPGLRGQGMARQGTLGAYGANPMQARPKRCSRHGVAALAVTGLPAWMPTCWRPWAPLQRPIRRGLKPIPASMP